MDDEPIELAAYAIMRVKDGMGMGPILGFTSIDQAHSWRESHHDWAEFGWSDPKYRDWKIERRKAEEERCRPPVEPPPGEREEG